MRSRRCKWDSQTPRYLSLKLDYHWQVGAAQMTNNRYKVYNIYQVSIDNQLLGIKFLDPRSRYEAQFTFQALYDLF